MKFPLLPEIPALPKRLAKAWRAAFLAFWRALLSKGKIFAPPIRIRENSPIIFNAKPLWPDGVYAMPRLLAARARLGAAEILPAVFRGGWNFSWICGNMGRSAACRDNSLTYWKRHEASLV